MKANSEVAKRYAKALFAAIGGAKTEEVLTQLREAQSILGQPKLHSLLSSPVLSRKEKVMVVEQSIANMKLSAEVEGLLKLLATKDRIGVLDSVVSSFETISDEKNNVLRGVVTSSEKLSKADQEQIKDAISKFTGNQLLLEYKEDPGLIGGVLARVGSYTFDGTLDTQLTKLKEQVNRSN
jgi:F-type H+-transporting ATPase subunit delta